MGNVMYYVSNGAQAAAPAAGMMGDRYFEPSMMPFAAHASVLGPAGLVVMLLGALVLFGFWVWMIVHAIKHDIKDQAVWILVLMLTNFWGAVIYYFAVKQKMDKHIHGSRHKQIL